MKMTRIILFALLIIFNFISISALAIDKQFAEPAYIKWLEDQSLLYDAERLSHLVSATRIQWQHPYAIPQTDMLTEHASVWFQAYPVSLITRDGEDIFQFLTDETLWQDLQKASVDVVHIGPLAKAGGISGYEYTPTVDGWFDRISLAIDPKFGTDSQYADVIKMATKHKIFIAGDIIPGHTGKGADFLLALRGYQDYPGIYDMVEIDEKDWSLLPAVTTQWQSANLTAEQVTALWHRGYIPGNLQRVLFSVPGAKKPVTGWDATGEILGIDGKIRRWVYLHYFKSGQPTMNWMDPTFAAGRIVAGQVIDSLLLRKERLLRIDANEYLGIEPSPHSMNAWSEHHPLSMNATQKIAWLIRRLGGWSYQEFNATLENLVETLKFGPDVSYDFVTRPAVEHAVLTGDAAFLHLMLNLMHKYEIEPNHLVHDMQNHDDITYELPHFIFHDQEKFFYHGHWLSGQELRNLIIKEMRDRALAPYATYNQLGGNGLCTTFAGLIAARLQVKDIYQLSLDQQQKIQKIHLLIALFNAMQPGIFSFSGWDAVGALPLKPTQIKELLVDGDCRWLNRGGVDLLDRNVQANTSLYGIPKAVSIYGPIPQQLKDPNSFMMQLINMLRVRDKYHLASAKQIDIPPVEHEGMIIMVHQLPNDAGIEITAINFGDSAVVEELDLFHLLHHTQERPASHQIINILTDKVDSFVEKHHKLKIQLGPLEGKALLWR